MNLDFREKYVSRDVSSGLKGVAILLMLFLHLFNNPARDAGMGYLLSVDGRPLCWWLSRFCSVCVPLYMFLSGYGLWIIHRRGGRMRNGRRVLLLWLNVAVVGVLFYPWSALRPELHWRFDAAGIMATFTGFNPYNAEWWFLFPWVFVCLLSPWVFRLMERWGTLRVLLLSFAVYFGLRYAIQWYGADRLVVGSARFAYEAMQVAILLFPFLLGSAAARHGVLVLFKNFRCGAKAIVVLLMTIVALVRIYLIPIGIFDPVIAAFVCCVAVMFPLSGLAVVGRESTHMWLCHTFFCAYYLPHWFDALHIPVLMFAVLVLVSYASSRVLTWAYRPLRRRVEAWMG